MDESRKQFEEWRISDSPTQNLYRDSHGQYAEIGAWIAWKAWQASRAAIEIKLPEACSCCYSEPEKEWHDSVMGEVTDILIAAGIKMKE